MSPEILEELEENELIPHQEPIRKPIKHLRRSKAASSDGIRGFIKDDDNYKDRKIFVKDPKGDYVYTPYTEPYISNPVKKKLLEKGCYVSYFRTNRSYRSRRNPVVDRAPTPIGGVSKYRRLRNRQAYWKATIEDSKAQQEAKHPRMRGNWDAPDLVEVLSSYPYNTGSYIVRWRGEIPDFLIQPWTNTNESKI